MAIATARCIYRLRTQVPEVESDLSAADGGPEVAKQRVDGLELRQLHALRSATKDEALVCGPTMAVARKHHRPSETTVAGVAL